MEAIEFLRSEYGDVRAIWNETPKQTLAYFDLAQARKRRERAEYLYATALASRGDPHEVNARLKELTKRPVRIVAPRNVQDDDGPNALLDFGKARSV
jgi:hypothetical protein